MSLEEQLAAKDAQLAEQAARIAELEKLVSELRERLEQNSSNSHRPPSSDPPGSRGRSGKAKDKKKGKRGGRKGHRGAHRVFVPPDQVDHFQHLFPGACELCCAPLPETPDENARRYQIIDLDGRGPWVTEIQRHEVVCTTGGCGHRTLAPFDPDKIPSSQFGPRLSAVIVLLTGAYHLSRRKTQKLLQELYGIKISLGGISNVEARMSKALVSAVEEAQREAEKADIKHTDATTWLQAGITMSLWTLATMMVTVYKIFANGRTETIRPLFGDEPEGILVSDRASVFGFWLMEFRQVCWAHLLRKFVSFSERDGPAGIIGNELLDCARLIFEYWHAFKDGRLTREELQIRMLPLQRQVEDNLERAEATGIPRLSGSCADILEHREALWTFVTRDGVEPTNNHAERELRGFVLWRKSSFGSQSQRGNRFAERVMTVVHTARKQSLAVLDFLVDSCIAHTSKTEPPRLLASVAPA